MEQPRKQEAVNRLPNVLYIMTDQQSADSMSCAGNAFLSTPALDRLASRSVRFNCAYTAFPLCVPARTAMFTGRMPHEAGVRDNYPERHTGLPFPMLGRLMTDAGYCSHYIGKWHIPSVAETDTQTHGFDEVVFGGGYGDLDRNKTAAAVKFLRRRHDRPFFLTISYNNPHDCCELSRDQQLRMGDIPSPPADMSQLPPLPDNHMMPENAPYVLREFQIMMKRFLPAHEWDEERTRRYIWGYNRLVEMVDREIGRVLEALEETGRIGNTVIIFASDHGDGRGCHRWNQKWSLYDESVRVPFIISAPVIVSPGSKNSWPVSPMLDFMSTVLDYANVMVPENCRGISIRPVLEGRRAPERECVVSETLLGEPNCCPEYKGNAGRMVRSEQFKYIIYQRGKDREQLFDMQSDPGEMSSLVKDPGHAEVLDKHRDYLRRWRRQTRDELI